MLAIDYRLANTGTLPFDYNWGIHPVAAISPDHRFDVPAARAEVDENGGGTLGVKGDTYDWPHFGGLDVLVHVMGGFAGGRTVAETDDATWDQMRDLNLSSAFYTFRAAIPYLRKSGSGRIVAIGSLSAAEPHAGLGAYVTFKSALTMLVRTVALENRDAGLMANVVLPGTMDTPANRKSMPNADFSKWVQPQDVAELVLSLSDRQGRHVTGVAVPIEGESV